MGEREFTSLEISRQLSELGLNIKSAVPYYWQHITPRALVEAEDHGTFAKQDGRWFVGEKIIQGSDILYRNIELVCRAYTFQQLFDFIKTCPPLIYSKISVVDQIALYIIKTRS